MEGGVLRKMEGEFKGASEGSIKGWNSGSVLLSNTNLGNGRYGAAHRSFGGPTPHLEPTHTDGYDDGGDGSSRGVVRENCESGYGDKNK